MTKHDDLLVILYRTRDRLEAVRHKLVLGQTDHESAVPELESCHKLIEDVLDSDDYKDVLSEPKMKLLLEHTERFMWSSILFAEDCANVIPNVKDFQDDGHRRMLRSHSELSSENVIRLIKAAREALHVVAYCIRSAQSMPEKDHVST